VGFAQIAIVFWVSHLVGDFLLQTDWQAAHKRGGLGRDRTSRLALFSHVSVYTLCFVPALIWVGSETGALAAVGLAAVIFLPHLVIDDGRLLNVYMLRVKRTAAPPPAGLTASVDQGLHLICLWATALLAVVWL
jgi:Protein of unknown function (DUF3307)